MYGVLDHLEVFELVSAEHGTTSRTREYVINPVVSARLDNHGQPVYKVRWYGYDPEYDSWLPRRDIPNNFVRHYWAKLGHTERALKKEGIPVHKFTTGSDQSASHQ